MTVDTFYDARVLDQWPACHQHSPDIVKFNLNFLLLDSTSQSATTHLLCSEHISHLSHKAAKTGLKPKTIHQCPEDPKIKKVNKWVNKSVIILICSSMLSVVCVHESVSANVRACVFSKRSSAEVLTHEDKQLSTV